jgi:hypothetical protein
VDRIPSLANVPLATPVPEKRKKRKGKGKAIASEDVVMSEAEIAEGRSQTVAEASTQGTKRALQDSPSKVEAPAKRSRTAKQGSSRMEDSPSTEDGSRAEERPHIAEKGVDLSGYEFDEETPVDLVLIPALMGQVRSGAVGRDSWLTGVLRLARVVRAGRVHASRSGIG